MERAARQSGANPRGRRHLPCTRRTRPYASRHPPSAAARQAGCRRTIRNARWSTAGSRAKATTLDPSGCKHDPRDRKSAEGLAG
eukprot:7385265-Prymnesium_polylepis.1